MPNYVIVKSTWDTCGDKAVHFALSDYRGPWLSKSEPSSIIQTLFWDLKSLKQIDFLQSQVINGTLMLDFRLVRLIIAIIIQWIEKVFQQMQYY